MPSGRYVMTRGCVSGDVPCWPLPHETASTVANAAKRIPIAVTVLLRHELDADERCDRQAGQVAVTVRMVVRDVDDLCLLYTSPSPRDGLLYRMPSSA